MLFGLVAIKRTVENVTPWTAIFLWLFKASAAHLNNRKKKKLKIYTKMLSNEFGLMDFLLLMFVATPVKLMSI